MKNLSELLEEAQTLPDRRRPAWAKYNPIVETLLEKGTSYQQAFDWLIARNQPLDPERFRQFRTSISTNRSRALKQAAKAAAKAKEKR